MVFFRSKSSLVHGQRGFTLLELLIVISISMVLLTTVLIQQSGWSNSIAMSSQAYELALNAREAQISSLAVKENLRGDPGTDRFDIGYGLFFDKASPNKYVYFADRNGNKYYDGTAEDLKVVTFNRGVYIDNITIAQGGGGGCDLPLTRNRISILFFRPTTRPTVCGTFPCFPPDYEPGACVFLKSPSDRRTLLLVNSAGEITTEKY